MGDRASDAGFFFFFFFFTISANPTTASQRSGETNDATAGQGIKYKHLARLSRHHFPATLRDRPRRTTDPVSR